MTNVLVLFTAFYYGALVIAIDDDDVFCSPIHIHGHDWPSSEAPCVNCFRKQIDGGSKEHMALLAPLASHLLPPFPGGGAATNALPLVLNCSQPSEKEEGG